MKLVWTKVLWYLRWNEAYFSTLLLYIKLKYSLLQVQRTKINIKNIFITKYYQVPSIEKIIFANIIKYKAWFKFEWRQVYDYYYDS